MWGWGRWEWTTSKLSAFITKERKREPSLAPALVGLMLDVLMFMRPSEEVGSFPPFTEEETDSRNSPKSHYEETRPPRFELTPSLGSFPSPTLPPESPKMNNSPGPAKQHCIYIYIYNRYRFLIRVGCLESATLTQPHDNLTAAIFLLLNHFIAANFSMLSIFLIFICHLIF